MQIALNHLEALENATPVRLGLYDYSPKLLLDPWDKFLD